MRRKNDTVTIKHPEGISVVVEGRIFPKRDETLEKSDADVMIGGLLQHHNDSPADMEWADIITILRQHGVNFQIFDV